MDTIPHEDTTTTLGEHLRPVFDSSPDRICSERFARNRPQALASPVTFRSRGRNRGGSRCLVETDMIALSVGGHTFARHIARRVG